MTADDLAFATRRRKSRRERHARASLRPGQVRGVGAVGSAADRQTRRDGLRLGRDADFTSGHLRHVQDVVEIEDVALVDEGGIARLTGT